ncbi:MAG: hypothetical protein HC889_06175 [Synechococcaceae cyanobacterium SM1_2_3]|nr:hypothetical protein [Synechococcaceae cyanobacterium SM1_2_3]
MKTSTNFSQEVSRSQSLESFSIGCHRRIEHSMLVNWLARNQSMERGD